MARDIAEIEGFTLTAYTVDRDWQRGSVGRVAYQISGPVGSVGVVGGLSPSILTSFALAAVRDQEEQRERGKAVG